MDADTKRYVRHLKIERTEMIFGRLLFTSLSQNFDVLSTFCGRKNVRLDVIQNTAYRGRVLRVKWPNQQCQSTEGSSSPKNSLQSHQVHLNMLQYYTCMQYTVI